MKRIAFLFPGQGSQYVGMCRDLYRTREDVRAVFETASSVTALDLASLCFDGPLDRLTETINLQPAVTAVNLSHLAVLRSEGIIPSVVAGHSLGEYSALHAAGVLDLEDTFRLVSERGRLMQREAERNPGGMIAALGLSIETVRGLIDEVKTRGTVALANHNTEKQIVATGEKEPLTALSERVTAMGGKAVALNVSGPWHSPLLRGAVDDFRVFMDGISFRQPVIPIFFNATAGPAAEPGEIREIMSRQICSTVLWYDIMNRMVADGVSVFVEVGPKKVLAGLLKKTLPSHGDYSVFQADDLDGILKIAEKLRE